VGTSQKRDADIDRLLRAVLKPAPRNGPGDCPDAGVLAAFIESGLTATEQSALEAHIVGCGRCQEALSVLSHDLPEEAAAEAAVPETRWFTWVTRPRLRWFVPIGAAATVAVVIFATRPLIAPEGEVVPASEVTRMARATPPPPAPASDVLADAAPAGRIGLDKKSADPAAGMMAARVASEEKRTPPAAPAATPAPAGGQLAPAQQAPSVLVAAGAARKQAAAEADRAAPAAVTRRDARNLESGLTTVSAPGGTVLWMFGAGGRLSRSRDAGATWHEQRSGVTVDLKAGEAPSPATCWIVGAAGTVLLTTDGERWERRPFPLPVDLTAVEASSARAAVVTTQDGRRFETLDGGLSWSQKQ